MRINPLNSTLRKSVWLLPALIPLLTGVALAQPNILQPSDPIIGSSLNTPSSEGVANAIDGTEAKYLNFDGATNTCGFAVTPQVGSTWVTGMGMQTANDSPNRDPYIVTLEGSDDSPADYSTNTTWTLITTITQPPITNRYFWRYYYFTNFTPYTSYRWTSVSNAGPGQNSMQISEVQLLGETVPPNVLQPSDRIIGSSLNTPSSEGVANAIDGTEAKYLNFDGATNTCGFVVTPQVGATVAQGIAMQTANDSPNRDPELVTLEGSTNANADYTTNTTWDLIATITQPPITNRYFFRTYLFENVTPYTSYRWTSVSNAGPGQNSMQVSEVQILGQSAPQNILLPSDRIIGSSLNTPSSEGVANAIDGTEAKYLNFDGATNTCGFVVTPSVGATTITGCGMQTANDSPNRDPELVTIEGSTNANADYSTNTTWDLIATITQPPITNRYFWRYYYFTNNTPYTSYRWTSVSNAGPGQNSMQISEVQLLAITSKNPCGKASFVSLPANASVLPGSTGTFQASVNGPWKIQWYTNGVEVPGATKPLYTTPPVTTANSNIAYTVGIVGCVTSPPVYAVLFTPSTTSSIGIQFIGDGTPVAQGANGSGIPLQSNDVAGVWPQAYWNCSTNAGSGNTGDGTELPNVLVDSSNNPSVITFTFATTSGAWGTGTGSALPDQLLYNGEVGNTGPGLQTYVFGNVPAGNYSLIAYSVAPPLEQGTASFAITNDIYTSNVPAIFEQVIPVGQYDTAPNFYFATSINPAKPSIGDVVRFNNIVPDSGDNITLTVNLTATVAGGRPIGVNSIQLLENPPAGGTPPVITTQPQFTVAVSNGVLTLTVDATGNNLTYQWLENGYNLFNGAPYSGVNTATLTISPFTDAQVGIYSVAVFNTAGSAVSQNASVAVTDYKITNGLVAEWPYDENSGTIGSNSIVGQDQVNFSGTVAWAPGQISNSVVLDGASTYGYVSNYIKGSTALSGSVWLNVSSIPGNNVAVFRNMQGAYVTSGGATTYFGQFSVDLFVDGTTGFLIPQATVGAGPANYIAAAPLANEITNTGWHHLAFSADGAALTLYVDGQNVDATPYLGDIATPTQPWIAVGCWLVTDTNTTPYPVDVDPTTPSLFPGNLDDMALWTRALTPAEVTAIYQAGLAGKPVTSVVETPATSPATLTAAVAGGNITVSWSPAGGNLESTPALKGAATVWTVVGTNNPAVIPVAPGSSFFRVANP